jgi:tRNA 2-thiouridine synthesizing protein E
MKGADVETAQQKAVENKLDCEGFFADSNFWSEDSVQHLANANEIGEYQLSENHWKVINYVREFYNKKGTGPSMVKVVKNTGLQLAQICSLFPCGLVKGAYRLAGLPKPPGCA